LVIRVKTRDPSLLRAHLRKLFGGTEDPFACRTLGDVTEVLEPEPRTGVRGLVSRFEHVLRELGKFGVVGGFSFLVDFAIFNVLRHVAGVESLTAATISMVIAASVAFVGNRFWTWRDRERTGLRREYALYFMFNLVGLVITLGCLALSTYGLGAIWPVFKGAIAENAAKNVVGMALATSFRFWSYRQIVFRR
jgi:putative flippase GtrA